MASPKHILRIVYTVVILIALLLIGLVPGQRAVASPPTQSSGVDFEWRLPIAPQPIAVSSSAETSTVISGFTLRNNATVTTTYELDVTSLPSGWRYEMSAPRLTLPPVDTTGYFITGISLRLIIPARTQGGSQNITVTAFKLDGSGKRGDRSDVFVTLSLLMGTPAPTAEPAPGCPEKNEPGNTFDAARLVRVDLEESHGICTTGDEDWFKFAAVGGKVYTVDISQMDAGLDLSLELFDEKRARLTSNDDFFNRNPGAPDPMDKRPRIQSWRAPANGIYTVRVRDTLGIGGNNLGYRFIVRGESFGPTPTTVPEVCNDSFEPDGLPEIAKLIFSNETQPRRLCPTGDADWAIFFAIAGRLYVIYTDTRPYAVRPDDPLNYPAPGADTVLLLADRDGQRMLDFNNDVPGGGTLDSEIQFRPVVDGFYYIQVKNVGDIGSQFIRYDLTVRACPGQYCRNSPPGAPGGAAQPTPTFGLLPAP